MAWRQDRAARLVQEVAGFMPADAPQARIAAALVIVREATDDTFAQANAPGLAVEQVCRLRRTAGALTNSAAALERTLARHQQKPTPFFGTVLDDGIDLAALAAGWGGPGSRRDGGKASDEGGDGPVAGTTPGTSARREARGTVAHGQGLPTSMSDPAVAMQPSPAGTVTGGPDDTAAPGGDGGLANGEVPPATAESTQGSSAGEQAPGTSAPPAMTMDVAEAVQPGPAMTEDSEPDAGTTSGVVTRLDQGPGWTLDVVRPRTGGDVVRPRMAPAVVGADKPIGAAPERVERTPGA